MRSLHRTRLAVCVGALVLWTANAWAHALEPASLRLREVEPNVFQVRWRASLLRLPGANVQPVLPAHCAARPDAAASEEPEHVILTWTIDCGARGVGGATIQVTDLAVAKINALVSIERIGEAPIQRVLSPRVTSFVIPMRPSRSQVARDYGRLGFEHILNGADHLLFVFGLLLLVSRFGLLVQTITAFTVGHSITLALAALGLAALPSRPVEVLIALSVLVLAVELAREAGGDTLLRRRPWLMASTFGLLHGFGFSGALAEAGLPQSQIALALLSFNLGIELGQLVFVGTIVLAAVGLTRLRPRFATRARMPAAYAMGILAAYWCLERLASWVARGA